jgi:hypothetical protein
MGRWWQVVGVEGKKEGGELSLKKVCFSMAAQLVAGTEGRTGRKLKEPVGEVGILVAGAAPRAFTAGTETD